MIAFKLFGRRHVDPNPGDEPPRWEDRRAAPTDADRVLLSATHVWLRRIPGHSQPKQLCRHYPRIANAIAASWDDPALGDRLLTDLLIDRRGDRAGFASRIVDELQVLRQLRVRARDRFHVAERRRWAVEDTFER